jgi:hypothetical protein
MGSGIMQGYKTRNVKNPNHRDPKDATSKDAGPSNSYEWERERNIRHTN